MLLSHRTASSSAAVARGTSSRVRPFTAASTRSSKAQEKQLRLVAARAAEEEEQQQPEAETEEVPEQPIAAEQFDFNLSEAKKGNQWQPSDVQAALDYYAAEKFLAGSSDLPYEAEFVTNPLSVYEGGPEDSSWLADVDNNEAYERDEYSLAGIPEAAPKMKRREEEEEDNTDELRALEDEKIGASAFDDVEGLEEDEDPNAAWIWAMDDAGGEEDAAAVASARDADDMDILSRITDADIIADGDLNSEEKEALMGLLDPLPDDDAVDLIGQELPEAPEETFAQALTQAEEAAIAAVLGDDEEGASSTEADEALAEAAKLVAAYSNKLTEAIDLAALQGEDAPLDQAVVAEYLSALKAMSSSDVGGYDDATLADLLAGEEAEEAGPSITVEAAPSLPAGIAELVAQQTPDLEPFKAVSDPAEAEADAALSLLDNIEALAAEVDNFSEAEMAAADLQGLEGMITAYEDYYAVGADEPLEERPLDAPVDPYADIDPELLGADAFGGDEEDNYADRYGTQFAERILELGRVTKVVKGGKLMGFRCVAVVGDGKGRVGVGCQAGREVGTAVKRALVDAKKNLVDVPLVGAGTIPHRSEAWFKAAGVVLQPAADGTGVIAGGAVRAVLELAGVQNVLGKRLGSRSTLNNARVTLKALGQLRTLSDYAEARGVPLDYMLS